jgi:hypothetical protein
LFLLNLDNQKNIPFPHHTLFPKMSVDSSSDEVSHLLLASVPPAVGNITTPPPLPTDGRRKSKHAKLYTLFVPTGRFYHSSQLRVPIVHCAACVDVYHRKVAEENADTSKLEHVHAAYAPTDIRRTYRDCIVHLRKCPHCPDWGMHKEPLEFLDANSDPQQPPSPNAEANRPPRRLHSETTKQTGVVAETVAEREVKRVKLHVARVEEDLAKEKLAQERHRTVFELLKQRKELQNLGYSPEEIDDALPLPNTKESVL